MAVVIRFARHGTKKRPFFRVVVQDKQAPRDGRFIELIGTFNPLEKDGGKWKSNPLRLNRARWEYWLSVGAKPSETLSNRTKQFLNNDLLPQTSVPRNSAAENSK